MSLFNGKLPRRVAAVLGSACFLGGISIAASSANAGIFVSLKPTTASVTALSGTLAGDIFSGYTLTVPPGTYNAGQLQVDLETAITDTNAGGTGVTALLTLRGAVRPALVSGTPTVAATTGVAFASSINGQTVRPDVFATARAGALVGPSGLIGVGPQSGSFGSSDSTNATTDLQRFEIQTSTTTADSLGVPAPLNVGSTAVRVGGLTVNTAGIAGDRLTLTVVGGGTTASSSFAQYFTDFDAATRPATLQLGVASDSKPLTVVFATPVVSVIKGNFGGNEDVDGGFNIPDGAFNSDDIDAFLTALTNRTVYQGYNPSFTPATYIALGDFGGTEDADGGFNIPDGAFNSDDIDAFLTALTRPAYYAGLQPGGRGVGAAIPEPSALGMLVAAMPLIGRRRR